MGVDAASGEGRTSSQLVRRVHVTEAFAFTALVAILLADHLVFPPTKAWGLVEAAAAVLVAALSLAMTRRLTARIRLLEGLVRVCMHCKCVKDGGRWVRVETYVARRSDVKFTHGLCPACYARDYGGLAEGGPAPASAPACAAESLE